GAPGSRNPGTPVAYGARPVPDDPAGGAATVGDTRGCGFVGATLPNDIYGNTTGVSLTGSMQNQHVFANTTGVTGSGVLGGSDLDKANLIETNVTGVNFAGTIQSNRIARNAIGIAASSGQLIDHNLIYRNTQTAIAISGKSAVRVV